MKLVKRLFQILGILLVLLVIAVGVFVATFDANTYKPQIVSAVEEQTGRSLAIEGDIGLSIFPRLGLELGAVRLGNAEGFGEEPFAASENVVVKVALLPLLRKELQVSKVVLDGLRLNLARKADGSTNWDDLVQPSAPPEAPGEQPPPEIEEPAEPAGPAIAGLAIGGIEITDARIAWRDAQAGQSLTIAPLELTTGAVAPGKDFPVKLQVTVEGEQPAVEATLELTARANLDLDAQQYRLEEVLLLVVANGAGLPVEGADLRLRADIAADMQAQRVTVSELDAKLETKGGPVDSAQIAMTGEVGAELAAQQYTVTALNLAVRAEGQDLPAGRAEASLAAAQARADLNAQTAALTGIKLVAYEVVAVTGDVDATTIVSSPRAKGTLRVAPFSPRELFAAMNIEPPETADDQVLRDLGAELAFDAETEAVRLSDVKIVLDDSTLQGGATVERPTTSPAIAFKLSVDAIDLDRYLPPPAEGEEPAAPVPAGGTGDEELPVPVEELRALDLDGQLTVGRLKLTNVRMQDVDLTVTAKDGLVQIRPLTLSMYEGRLHATSTVDVRGETPKYHLTPKLEGVQMGPLLEDYMGNDKLSGTTTARLDLTTAGSTLGAIKSALDGSLAFEFKDGAIEGFNLRHMIETAEARLKQQAAPEPLTRETDFSAITVSGTIKDGRLTSTDLDALSPFLRVGGQGWVDLAKDALDYTARIKIVGSEEGQGGKGLEELKGLTIPIALKGSFTDLDYDIEIEEALKDAALAKQKEKLEAEKARLKAEQEAEKKELEAKLEAEKEAEKKELDEKLDKERDKLKDKLKGLF